MTNGPICPCDGAPTAQAITNPPAHDRIDYRVGDFRSFRRALLNTPPAPFDGEQQLADWRPSAKDDLGTQMLEWWAYLADILTFYNERIANESYLRTAQRPESVRRLIRTLGYRPRPGIAARGMLAALVGGHRPLTLPRGFSVDSKPGPGEQPQTFELDADTVVTPARAVPAAPPAYAFAPDGTPFLLVGTKPAFKAGAALMLESRNAKFAPLLLTVNEIATATAADGTMRSRVAYTASGAVPANVAAADLLLLQATQNMPSSSIDASSVADKAIHLAGLARDIHAGDTVLITAPGQNPQLRAVASIKDAVWYVNFKHPPKSAKTKHAARKAGTTAVYGPTVPVDPVIPITHSVLAFDVALGTSSTAGATLVGYGWRSAGQLLDQAVASYSGGTLHARAPAVFPAGGKPAAILIGDSAESGMPGQGSSSDGHSLAVSALPQPPAALKTPLTVHYNLLPVSRGKSVPSEVLGSGNAAAAGQIFTLKKSPLTYLAKGDSFASTLRVWVNGREWPEAASFYDQPPDAEIFVTAEDDEQKTRVIFGDGVNGARLPTGANNIVATYRTGSGAKSPSAGTLTVIGKPYPNLGSLKNPVAVGGGADPDPPEQIRRYAPRSVMTFGRAISGDDYQVIAAQAPGVTRTQAAWSFNADEQRSAVTIYVGDDNAALDSAAAAIAATGDPHRRVAIVAAVPVAVTLSLRLLIDARYIADDVAAATRTALLDEHVGVFGKHRLGIGEAVFNSQVDAACLAIDGIIAVHDIVFKANGAADAGERHAPGEGAFYRLDAEELAIDNQVVTHDG